METPDVEGLLQHEDPPTAIIAANDRMALGVIAAAIDLHIPVSDFVSVVGLDNIAAPLYTRPSLTTVDSPAALVGLSHHQDHSPQSLAVEPRCAWLERLYK